MLVHRLPRQLIRDRLRTRLRPKPFCRIWWIRTWVQVLACFRRGEKETSSRVRHFLFLIAISMSSTSSKANETNSRRSGNGGRARLAPMPMASRKASSQDAISRPSRWRRRVIGFGAEAMLRLGRSRVDCRIVAHPFPTLGDRRLDFRTGISSKNDRDDTLCLTLPRNLQPSTTRRTRLETKGYSSGG